jgi:hypothetical protein
MKTIAYFDEIRAEIRDRIAVSNWANGYCRTCEAPILTRIEHDGIANWIAHPAATVRGCEGFLLEIIASVRRDYDLPPQSLPETIRELLSARKSPF